MDTKGKEIIDKILGAVDNGDLSLLYEIVGMEVSGDNDEHERTLSCFRKKDR